MMDQLLFVPVQPQPPGGNCRSKLDPFKHWGERFIVGALCTCLGLIGGCKPAAREADTTAESRPPATEEFVEPAAVDRVAEPPSSIAKVPLPSALNPEAQKDSLAIDVPDGDAQELIEFLSDVTQRDLRGTTEEERNQDIARQMEARILASERLAQHDDPMYREIAVQTTIDSLRMLTFLDQQHADQRLQNYAQALAELPDARISKYGRMGLFQVQLNELLTKGPESKTSPEQVVGLLKKLLADEEPDLNLLQVANESATLLSQVGLTQEGLQAFELIHATFGDHSDSQLAEGARTAMRQASGLRMRSMMEQVMEGDETALPPLIDAARSLIDAENPSAQTLGQLLSIAQNMEFGGAVGSAQKFYDLVAEFLPKLDEQQTLPLKEMLAGARQRLGLIGEPFSVAGVTLDGSPFSWEDYQDKVVLVDYWASWCRPCIEEIPHVLANYERFHDLGFEVVGVNLDDNLEAARNFLERNALPWTTVVSESDDSRGFDDPNAVQHGVTAIPFLVLVNRDGTVDSLHLRGERLTRRLEELLPETADDFEDEAARPLGEATEPMGEIELDTQPPAGADGDTLGDDSEEASPSLELDTEMLPPDDPPQAAVNSYLAPSELSAQELVLQLLEMKDKPKSIQSRPGFREALADVADRVLASSAPANQQQLAARLKFEILHRAACLGDDDAQRQLEASVEQLRTRMPDALAAEIELFDREQSVQLTETSAETLVGQIDGITAYLEQLGTAIDTRHLRLASNTVELINRLAGEERDPHFDRIAKALLQSNQRDVSRYGKTILASSAAPNLIGQKIELRGITAEGQVFDIESLQGSIVVVEFWATWCGACRQAQPRLQAELQKRPEIRSVHVSLDGDQQALRDFLDKSALPGDVLHGDDAQQAAARFGVRAIPAYFVVDKESKVLSMTSQVDRLARLVDSALDRNS